MHSYLRRIARAQDLLIFKRTDNFCISKIICKVVRHTKLLNRDSFVLKLIYLLWNQNWSLERDCVAAVIICYNHSIHIS